MIMGVIVAVDRRVAGSGLVTSYERLKEHRAAKKDAAFLTFGREGTPIQQRKRKACAVLVTVTTSRRQREIFGVVCF